MGVVAVLASLAATVLLPPAPAYAATTATFTRVSEWGSGYVGEMTVRNDTDTRLSGWRVEFDLPAGTTIGSHWNATLTRSGNRYVFTDVGWNGALAPGARTSFGWMAGGTGGPVDCTLDGLPCAGGPDPDDGIDVSPPGTPQNPQLSTVSIGTAITWDPAPDDRGVVRYEIVANGNPFATTTGTRYWIGGALPPMLYTFGISAVDAAGNRSPYAIVYAGQPGDTGPPTAPTGLGGFTLVEDHLAIRWEASRDDIFVAGYEVLLNDRLIFRTGGTSGYVPYTGYGTYWVAVRAFDHLGKFSDYTRVGLAIDPPPPPPPSER